MTPTEKIAAFIEIAPPKTAEELAFWVKAQRDNGWSDQTICSKMIDAFRFVNAEIESRKKEEGA